MKSFHWEKGALIGAIVAAVVASLCCVGPLVLLAFGISGAWLGTLTHLPLLRPLGMIVTLLCLSLAFWRLYVMPKRCGVETACAKPALLHIQRIIFWLVTIVLLLLLTFPWYAFLFY